MASDAPTHRQFFGDAERDFHLTPEMIQELERVTGRGIGGLCRSVFASDFRLVEITETIRLGLIGGGADPQEAASLVKTYVEGRPLVEGLGLAVAVLEVAMLGKRTDDA